MTSLSKRKNFPVILPKQTITTAELSLSSSFKQHKHHLQRRYRQNRRIGNHDWTIATRIVTTFFVFILLLGLYFHLGPLSWNDRPSTNQHHLDHLSLDGNNIMKKDGDHTTIIDAEALHVYADSIRMDMPANDIIGSEMPYDIEDCPEYPPDNYPLEWNLVELLDHWNPKDVQIPIDGIYQGLCIFNTAEEAIHYRNAEVPFVIRKDPMLLPTVYRWNSNPDYLVDRLGRKETYMVERSPNNHLLFQQPQNKRNRRKKSQEDGLSLVEMLQMTYPDWLKKADVSQDYSPNDPHYYFRFNGKHIHHWLYQELLIFHPNIKMNYISDIFGTLSRNQKLKNNNENYGGIHCRFGMVGNMAECHYDNTRNFVTILGGQRRYILSHPRSCDQLQLYPEHHSSARHSSIDWTLPSNVLRERYPSITKATANEIILQAGDVLYLPSYWFHTIISLSLNWQCNARAGTDPNDSNLPFIQQCGFQNYVSIFDLFSFH